jgi:hypothetical protein
MRGVRHAISLGDLSGILSGNVSMT